VVLLAGVSLVGFTLGSRIGFPVSLNFSEIRFYEAMVAGLMLGATAVVVTTSSRLTAVVALGVVGLGLALIFILFSAPDLAITLFSIETLTVLLFVFILYRLPRFADYSSRATRLRDATIAIISGLLMTWLVLVVISLPHPGHVAEYFAEQSWTLAQGRNVVNVILVDFRGLDTLGEIVVLTVAALGVYSLVNLVPQLPSVEPEEEKGA
jgi:multicomponent Na+:H+ antiporter subunit A